MASTKRVLLFGDQTVDVCTAVKDLARQSRQSITLHTFLQTASDALQSETAKLHTRERERFQGFDSVLSIADAYENGPPDVVISTILLCVVQLGALIL